MLLIDYDLSVELLCMTNLLSEESFIALGPMILCSTEPSCSQDKLIVYTCSGVRPRGCLLLLWCIYMYISKSMQIPGTKAIRTQFQPSKPKREITKIRNIENTKRTYGQPNELLFPKRWPLSNPNRTKNNTNTHYMERHRTILFKHILL